ISQFKFHSRLGIGASFAYLLAERFQHTARRLPTSAQPQLLLPVPLHPRRMNMRGDLISLRSWSEDCPASLASPLAGDWSNGSGTPAR
ncbi:MAG: hypothetical protein ACPHCV_02885, partial [Pseudohongiellaceae bacterium]